MPQITAFITNLQQYQRPGVFNPWRDIHPSLDIHPDAPAIRRRQLELFLRMRLNQARYLLIAEALSYQGGRFTGIPMTSERILLGHQPELDYTQILGQPGERTSNPVCPDFNLTQQQFGFAEPTATIVWGALLEHLKPREFILWNTFPFHPFKNEDNPLTNRTPTNQELADGLNYAEELLKIFPEVKLITIGRLAAQTLKKIKSDVTQVPHPAQGHANDFRNEIKKTL
jgi:hypothetical protein